MNAHNFKIALAFITVAVMACAAESAELRVDNIPMYGKPGISRPAVLQKADADFIETASAGFGGDRSAARKVWYSEGDRFLYESNADYAMRRYNQAWLLDPQNYQPYWGFARVLVQTDSFKEAILHFETAIGLCDDDYQKVALLSDMAVAYSYSKDFQRANDLFRESTELDATYENAWYRWSQSLYSQADYAGAWAKLKEARALGANVSKAYVRDLKKKMREPK